MVGLYNLTLHVDVMVSVISNQVCPSIGIYRDNNDIKLGISMIHLKLGK